MRDSVLFYRSFVEAIDMLPEDEQLKAYRAIARYGLDGTEPEPEIDSVYMAVFLLAKPQIDANNRRYENGKRGGRPKATDKEAGNNQAETKTKPKQNQAETEAEPNYKVKVKDKVKVNNNTPKGGAGGKETQAQLLERMLIGRAVSHDIADALSEWVSYKTQRNERYKEAGMRSLITQAVNTAAENGPQAVIDAINLSMASNYKGIVWDRAKSRTGRFNNAPARSYNMDDLERKILASN